MLESQLEVRIKTSFIIYIIHGVRMFSEKENYPLMETPFVLVPFEEMNKKQVEQYFSGLWLKRISELFN